uniref:Ig-like domain-containing protein n=1 Tax=Poecilia formosa TaxID=48698 RepID=A0A096LY94_POEFO
MDEFRWITTFLSLILTITGKDTVQIFIRIRDGDEVSLPAECFRNQKKTCSKTTWIFTGQRNTTETLFECGKIHKDARTKSDKLSVTSNCSLVIKKISVEDVGLYVCRQFKSSGHQVTESVADLSVVNSEYLLTEQKISDETILICSVSSFGGRCPQSVKWLYDNKDDENIKTITPPQSACSATVSFTTSPHVSTSKRSELFRCQVKPEEDMKEFSFRISPLREKTDILMMTVNVEITHG